MVVNLCRSHHRCRILGRRQSSEDRSLGVDTARASDDRLAVLGALRTLPAR
jgi:hypothetical protein